MSNETEQVGWANVNATPTATLTTHATDLGALFDAAKETFHPSVVNVPRGDAESMPTLVIPKAMNAIDLKPWLDARREFPRRAEGESTHETIASLIGHVQRTRDEGSVAWLATTDTSAALTVVYDYHEAQERRRVKGDGSSYAGEDGVARWCKRTATHAFPLSKEWRAWRAVSGKGLTQAEFAAFIEDHVAEIRGADAARGGRALELALLLAQGDEAYSETMSAEELAALAMRRVGSPSQLVKMARRIALTLEMRAEEMRDESGNVSVVFRAEANAEGVRGEERSRVALPSLFVIEVPVLEGGTAYRLPVRLSTKIASQRAQWTMTLHRADAAFADAVADAARAFSDATGVPVFRGKSESKG